jgi:hypothetical protein
MSEERSTGLEGLIEALKESTFLRAGEKTSEGVSEAQICGVHLQVSCRTGQGLEGGG